MDPRGFITVATNLENAGLLWNPEVGDEVSQRDERDHISILVDLCVMSPLQLRSQFIWLPTVEQMVAQFEARKAILFHAGLEMTENFMTYKAVIQSPKGHIEASGNSLRVTLGLALRDLLLESDAAKFH